MLISHILVTIYSIVLVLITKICIGQKKSFSFSTIPKTKPSLFTKHDHHVISLAHEILNLLIIHIEKKKDLHLQYTMRNET